MRLIGLLRSWRSVYSGVVDRLGELLLFPWRYVDSKGKPWKSIHWHANSWKRSTLKVSSSACYSSLSLLHLSCSIAFYCWRNLISPQQKTTSQHDHKPIVKYTNTSTCWPRLIQLMCVCSSPWLITVFVLSADAGSGSGDDGKITHLIRPPTPPLLQLCIRCCFSSICFSLCSSLWHKTFYFPHVEHNFTSR